MSNKEYQKIKFRAKKERELTCLSSIQFMLTIQVMLSMRLKNISHSPIKGVFQKGKKGEKKPFPFPTI